MGAHRERQPEDTPEQTAGTAPAPRVPALPGRGFSPHALNRAGVIALQRLVGNAAVAEMVQARERPEMRQADRAGAGQAGAPAGAGGGEAGGAGGAPLAVAAGASGGRGGAPPAHVNGVRPAAITVARAVAAPPAPSPAAPAAPGVDGDIRDPHDEPGFKAMKGAAKGAGVRSKTHQPAAEGAATAQGAALPPSNDVASQAAAAQVDEMGRQQPGVFDRKAFIAAVKKAIDAATPKNLEEADDFKGSGKAGQAKEEVQGLVKGGKKESEKNIKQATDAPPDASKATPKPVTPMVNDEPGAPPADVGAAGAMPKPRPAQQTDLSAGPAEVDAKMADAEVTDEQLKKSNEPEFTGALDARDAAKQHSATAPGEYRAKEQDVLAKGRGEAEGTAGAELKGMHGARVQALTKVVGHKGETKGADQEKRAKVATDVQGIYDRTKTDVTKTLDALDGKVDAAFSRGESTARSQFEDYVGKRMSAYKDERYSGLTGGLKWAKDKLFGMPDEVNRFYEDGKRGYLAAMDGVIGEVADIVGTELTAARARIAEGRAEVQRYVAKLPADLRDVGREAADKLEGQFDQLTSDVDSKQEALVDKLAQKYVESRDALDARIEELQAANKGWVNKALDAVVGVVNTILKLKDMLLNVLARAADAIGDIIKDPIGFLGNLIDGVKGGLNKFVGRIATHLQDGLMGWLFGALGSAGITMPKALDFAGILDLVLQVLGLTYQNVRARIAKLVGEPLVAKMEKTVDVIRDFASKGIAGAWEWIKDKIGDLEDMVLGQIKEFVIEKVIKSGIVWIISLLNPAAAFVKACKAIYDIVMFIVERGSQIMEFVNSIIDSIGAIAKGSVGVVVDKIEGALAQALPLAISFLASLLGLGGISDKIRSVIDAVRSPINKAIDAVVGGAVKTFKKMFGGAIGWAKGKLDKGKAYVKGKVEAGKQWAKGTAGKLKDRLTGRSEQSPEQKEAELTGGLAALDDVTARYSGKGATLKELKAAVAGVKRRFRVFKSIEVVADGESWDYVYTASPPRTKDGPKQKGGTFKLVPGGLEKQERRVLEGVKKGKPVHLFANHVYPDEEQLVERLEEQVAKFAQMRADRIADEHKKIADAEAAMAALDVAPEPTSKKDKKVADAVGKRGADYFKHSEAIRSARKRINELEQMDPSNRETMLEQLGKWDSSMPTAYASKFKSTAVLEESVRHAIEENQPKIDAAFADKPRGQSLTIRATFAKSIGVGFMLNSRNEVVPTPSMMKSIVIILVVVDEVEGLFVVETAYPE
jgi:hypothetical protein